MRACRLLMATFSRSGPQSRSLRRMAAGFSVLIGAGAMAGPAAAADFTWSGADTATPGPNWSDAANWSGGVAPASASTIGTLSFPALTSSACTASSQLATCYQSNNDRSDLTVDQIAIHDSSYTITGDPVTLDGGLQTDGPDEFGSAELSLPLTLGADQTWDLSSGLDLGSPLAGDHGLTVENPVELGISGDNEIGPISITGGTVSFFGADLNSVSGNAVTLTDAALDIYGPSAAMGAFSSVGTDVLLGLPGGGMGPVSLQTASASFDSGSSLGMKLGSELSSTGRIALGNATLGLAPTFHMPACDGSPLGTVYTLVSTTGALHGRFGNAHQGAVLSDGCDEYRIIYHRHTKPRTVSATLLGSPTVTSLAASPTPAIGGQPVTLTATVTSPEEPGALSGDTVAFHHGGAAITGCGAVSLAYVGASNDYVAACTTSFPASAHPRQVALRATFTPPAGSDDLTSHGTTKLTVS